MGRTLVYSIIAPGQTLGPDQQAALLSLRFIPRQGLFPTANPPVPTTGPPAHRTIKGGVFSGNTLTLTPANGIHAGAHTYSHWVAAPKTWTVAYSVDCAGAAAYLTIGIDDLHGRVLDRVLHRSGAAHNVRQVENVAGTLRLDVQTHCASWSVTAFPVYS